MERGHIKEQYKVFNDPIHGHMELHPLLIAIIDTPQFQRLRNIKQLGGAYFVYPGASHNRFEHSIGVAYLAGKLAKALIERQKEEKQKTEPGEQKEKKTEEEIELENTRDILCVQIAGLCHDLGHGPFSHLFDGPFRNKMVEKMINDAKEETDIKKQKEIKDNAEKLKKWKHEKGSCEMFGYLVEQNDLKPVMEKYGLKPEEDMDFIKDMIDTDRRRDQGGQTNINRREKKAFLYDIVSNKSNGVDVDKFDYLARDSYHLGIQNNFDYRRFMKFAKVCEVEGGKYVICTRDKEVDNMYDLFHTRHCLHRRAYQHKVNKIIENMIAEAFVKADGHITIHEAEVDGEMISYTLSTAMNDMEAYTKLTDSVFEQILHSTSDDLSEARAILKNIRSRKIPRFLGETRPKKEINGSKLETLISEWKTLLAQHLPQEDLEVLVTKMDYGMKEENPVEHMFFYSKFEPTKAEKIIGDQAKRIRTTCFSEKLIRVYDRNTGDRTRPIATQEDLDEWWESLTEPQGEGTSASRK